MSGILEQLKTLLGGPRENALLHFSLGNEYFKLADWDNATTHFRQAVSMDADYSAAWKMLGKSLLSGNQSQQAVEVFEKGIAVAEKRGDVQAGREMRVFLKRAGKQQE